MGRQSNDSRGSPQGNARSDMLIKFGCQRVMVHLVFAGLRLASGIVILKTTIDESEFGAEYTGGNWEIITRSVRSIK